jgi:hypothetical protein
MLHELARGIDVGQRRRRDRKAGRMQFEQIDQRRDRGKDREGVPTHNAQAGEHDRTDQQTA